MIPPVAKKIEIMAWYFLNTGNEKERKDIIQQAYRIRGKDALHGLAVLTGYSYNRLVKIGRIWEIRKEINCARRGRGDGKGKIRREKRLAVEAVEVAAQIKERVSGPLNNPQKRAWGSFESTFR